MSNYTGLASRVDAAFAQYLKDDSYRDSSAQSEAIRQANEQWQRTHMVEATGTDAHFKYLQRAMLTARNAERDPPPRDPGNEPKHGLQFCSGRQVLMREEEVARRPGEYIPSRKENQKEFSGSAGGVFQGFQDFKEDKSVRPLGRSSRLLVNPEPDAHQDNIKSRTRPFNRLDYHVVDQNSRHRPTQAELLAEGDVTESVEIELEAPQRLTREQHEQRARLEYQEIQNLKRVRRSRSRENADGSVTIDLD
jgi:hypothetical protein